MWFPFCIEQFQSFHFCLNLLIHMLVHYTLVVHSIHEGFTSAITGRFVEECPVCSLIVVADNRWTYWPHVEVSTDYPPTIKSWPMHAGHILGWESTNYWPTINQMSTDYRLTVCQHVDWLSTATSTNISDKTSWLIWSKISIFFFSLLEPLHQNIPSTTKGNTLE